MSDPYIVIVTLDPAPWDSDSDDEVKVYEFNGPDQARVFYERGVEIAGKPAIGQRTDKEFVDPMYAMYIKTPPRAA